MVYVNQDISRMRTLGLVFRDQTAEAGNITVQEQSCVTGLKKTKLG